MASPSAGDPSLKYGGVNTVTPSPGEVKGLKIKLEIIFVIIREDLYENYFFTLNNLKFNLACFSKSIIYSPNNNINNDSNNFFGFGGFISLKEKIINFIYDFIKSVNSKIQLNPKICVKIDYNSKLTFEKIRNEDDIIIQKLYVLFKKIERNEDRINEEDINKFNNILVNNLFYDKISGLIIPLNNVKKIPLEIVTKFWIRYYISESSFYPYMNA